MTPEQIAKSQTDRLVKSLELSEEQQKKLYDYNLANIKKQQAERQKMMGNREDMQKRMEEFRNMTDEQRQEFFAKQRKEQEASKAAQTKAMKEILTEANRKYYVENAPTLSDYEFDMLLKELEALEREHPEYATSDSPTQNVGSDLFRPAATATPKTEATAKSKRGKAEKPKKEFEQHPHRYPMLSLGNTYDITEVQAFADRAEKGIGNSFTFSCELKFDGTAICLTYRNGKLFRALTRGDGTLGDDVTRNVKHI
jgi:NAD-dependent DNA ligase